MKVSIVILFLSLAIAGWTQTANQPQFDIKDFSEKAQVAEWLCEYDRIAWLTSDSVMAQDKSEIARLGNEWFCFKRHDTWHAVYGKFENNTYDIVFHYEVKDGKISRSDQAVDTTLLNTYSRALQTSGQQIKALRDSINLRFNQYIRKNEDNSLSVWLMPAFQPNSVALYGGEFVYRLDPTGRRVLADESYFQKQFRGFKVDNPREIWLDYTEREKPTLGAVFFAWYYKPYFTKIVINTSKSTSSPFKSDSGWTWIHHEK